ncbi:MAG: hypothetical protein LAO20_16775 [Acidobacteriia bacterium]|nr:hypothetical protein [Terriglobia bacterium]
MANKRRRKVGERPQVRQPLKMDRLPQELLDRVMKERAAGRTWSEIQDMSPSFKEWETVAADAETLKQFPGGRIPQTTLFRWYDLRVEQVKREMLADQTRAREIAALFAGKDFKDLPDAVRNALGDQLFAMMQNADDKSRTKVVSGLLALGELLSNHRKLDIQERKQKTDEQALKLKIEQIKDKVVALKKDVEKKKQLSPEQLKQRVDEIYGLGAA